ncbi:unnamed protein product [Closterium sp. NIES-54]
MAAAKRVLRYLCSTSGLGLVLGGRRPVVLTGHADASWADDQATQRSSQGYIFSLGSGSVSWRSTRSSSVLGSSYNKAMLALCREHRLEHRTKHIALCYLLARELQQRGQLRLAYVASEANTADIFTKALPPGDHQRFCTMLEAAALFYWRLMKCRLDDKWDALVAACWRDFAPMANCLLGIVKPISDTSPADASEQQRPAPIIAAEARQQAAENRRQGRDAARAAMGRGTTSRAHGRGAEDASAAGATPTEPEPPSESTTGPMAQPADPCHQLAARSSVWIDACICTTFQLCTHPETCKDRLHPQLHPYGPATCQALVLVSLDHPWPDVGSANPGVNTTADAEEEDEEDADAEEADAEEADAEEADTEDVEALPTSEGVQAEAGVDNDDNTPDSGVADGDHTTHVRTGFRQNKRGTRKKLGINLVHRNRLKAPTRRFGIFTSNAAEQVNSSIVPIRRLPVTPMLGGLMDWYRNRYCECKMAVLERTDLLTEAAEERMVEKETRAEGYELLGGDHEEGTIQTRDTDDPKKWRSFNVNLAAHRDQTYQGRSTRGGLSSMGRRAQRKRW